MASEPLRVLVWAAYPALRAGISQLVRGAGLAACETASLDAIELAGADVDVLVADVADEGSALDVTRAAAALALPAVLMAPDDLPPPRALLDGEAARGWVSRATSAEELGAAIRAVAAGFLVVEPGMAPAAGEAPAAGRDGVEAESPLTPRELDVLEWLALGLPNKAIALKLGISEHTVKFHVGSVLSKLDAGSRTEAVTTAARRGLLAL